jgi:two-component system, OmpR family, heavy metal sensor histidine kinase CusS
MRTVNAARRQPARGSHRKPLSLTARLAMLFALVAASLLLLVGILSARAIEKHFDELDEHDLSAKLTTIGQLISDVSSEAELGGLSQRMNDVLSGYDRISVLLRDAEGNVIFAQRPQSFEAAHIAGASLPDLRHAWIRDGRHFIGRGHGFVLALDEPMAVQALVALDVSHHIHFLHELRNRLWIGISLAAAVAALLGWLAAKRGLAPLARVTAAARRLSAEQLGERIDERDAPAELCELVEALNGMLDRLQSSFHRLSEFSADLAHELRTPISNLMTETQVALSHSRSEADYREVMMSNLEELERIARMVSDMLFLARADNGLLPRPAEAVELAKEAGALAEFYEALADERGVRVSVTGQATVCGERLMLRRALSNLLSNALRHTPSGGEVRIDITTGAEGVRLAVSNPGEPIPAEQLARLFERFHRVGRARSRQGEAEGEGAGLGLAITRSIAEAHGGCIEVRSDEALTVFTLRLPPSGVAPAERRAAASEGTGIRSRPAAAVGAGGTRGAG